MQRIVIDTNVFVSGIFYRGTPGDVLDHIADATITPCFTVATLEELSRVLSDKKFAPERKELFFDVQRYMDSLVRVALVFPRPSVPEVIQDDPADNEILACAVVSQASFIVSGDRHLLALGSYSGIPIVAPEAFIREIKK